MAPVYRSTLRAQWLGHVLRGLRQQNKLTLKEVGEYLQRNPSALSRIESGEQPARRGDVLAMLDIYGVDDPHHRDDILKLATETWQKGWWSKYTDAVPSHVIDYVWLENRSETIRAYGVSTINALLQTRGYAEAMIRAVDPDADDAQVKNWLDLRMARQRSLGYEDPLRLSVILDEAIIHRPIGGPAIMAAQLDYLVEQAQRPNIALRVLPFRIGEHAGTGGPFRLHSMAYPFPQVGYVEGPAGSLYLEADDADRLSEMYDRLWNAALSDDESAEIIAAAAKEFRGREST